MSQAREGFLDSRLARSGNIIICLSVRIVCRVREISGRYKFGEEFALMVHPIHLCTHQRIMPIQISTPPRYRTTMAQSTS